MKPLRYFYMNTAEILDKIFDIYKKTFLYQLLRILIIGAVSYILYAVLFVVAVIFRFTSIPVLLEGGNITSNIVMGVVFFILLFILVYLLITSAHTACSLSICSHAFYEKKPNFNTVIKETVKSVFKVFSVNILMLIIYIPVCILFVFIILASGLFNELGLPDFGLFNFGTVSAFLLLLAVMLLIFIAVIFVQTLASCAMGCAAYEKLSFVNALKKSLQLTKGNRFKILLVLLLWYAVTSVISYSISAISVLPTVIAPIFNYSLSTSSYYMPMIVAAEYVVIFLSSIIMAPFNDIILCVIYFNQKIKKEGMDIIMELETESA